ncbi:MAG: hypothetical protein A3F12_00965 [Gammaproteobacteria bacterium RIFCSPHIGHO2_12_FULL_38_14]|nr:MAG: hypothetical protein A3F12_00965 [Gammaproteobacteria bacterium RIFCSPHIGHO2_12_FULL_38_14]
MFLQHSANIIGIVGVIFVLIAFFLLNMNKLAAKHLSYQLLNFFGASFILFSLMFEWNTASVLIESAWVVISVMGLYQAIRTKQKTTS